MTQRSLLDSPGTDRRGRQPRPLPPSCALCPARAETPFGLCRGCLRAAADEYARLTPQAPVPDDGRPASVPYAAICRRCGSNRHGTAGCTA